MYIKKLYLRYFKFFEENYTTSLKHIQSNDQTIQTRILDLKKTIFYQKKKYFT